MGTAQLRQALRRAETESRSVDAARLQSMIDDRHATESAAFSIPPVAPGIFAPTGARPTSAPRSAPGRTAARLLFDVEQRVGAARLHAKSRATAAAADPLLSRAGIEARRQQVRDEHAATLAAIAADVQRRAVLPLRMARQKLEGEQIRRREVMTERRRAELAEIRSALQGLSDTKRNEVLLTAAQQQDLDVLEAATTYSPVLDAIDGLQVSGTLKGRTDRDSLRQAFVAAAWPDDAEDVAELEAMTRATVHTLAIAAYATGQEIGEPSPGHVGADQLRTLRAEWQQSGLDPFTRTDINAVSTEGQGHGREPAEQIIARGKSHLPELEAEASKIVVTDSTA